MAADDTFSHAPPLIMPRVEGMIETVSAPGLARPLWLAPLGLVLPWRFDSRHLSVGGSLTPGTFFSWPSRTR